MKKILSFGEIIWDVFPDGESVIGGAPLNFAAHAVKCGLQASLLSAIGNDTLGEKAILALNELGVDASFVSKAELPTGRCIVTLQNGSPSYEVCRPAAYDRIPFTAEQAERIQNAQFDAFCFGTLAARESESRQTLQKLLAAGSLGKIFCDINLRPDCYDEESIKLCFAHASILKISEEEEPLLTSFPFYRELCPDGLAKQVASLFAAYPAFELILFTKGSEGAVIYQRDGKKTPIAPCKTSVVSTVGAGDSFGASFLSAYLGGATIEEAGALAARISAFVVSHKEAVPEYQL